MLMADAHVVDERPFRGEITAWPAAPLARSTPTATSRRRGLPSLCAARRKERESFIAQYRAEHGWPAVTAYTVDPLN
jgi:hypothetical protein